MNFKKSVNDNKLIILQIKIGEALEYLSSEGRDLFDDDYEIWTDELDIMN